MHDDTVSESLLSSGMTEGNILQFLAGIERRVSEIAQMVAATKAGHSLASLPKDGPSSRSVPTAGMKRAIAMSCHRTTGARIAFAAVRNP